MKQNELIFYFTVKVFLNILLLMILKRVFMINLEKELSAVFPFDINELEKKDKGGAGCRIGGMIQRYAYYLDIFRALKTDIFKI